MAVPTYEEWKASKRASVPTYEQWKAQKTGEPEPPRRRGLLESVQNFFTNPEGPVQRQGAAIGRFSQSPFSSPVSTIRQFAKRDSLVAPIGAGLTPEQTAVAERVVRKPVSTEPVATDPVNVLKAFVAQQFSQGIFGGSENSAVIAQNLLRQASLTGDAEERDRLVSEANQYRFSALSGMASGEIFGGGTRVVLPGKVAASPAILDAAARNILGVERGASPEAIRAAYYRAAHDVHPDLGGTAADFHRVQTAYDYITNPKRANLDLSALTTVPQRPVVTPQQLPERAPLPSAATGIEPFPSNVPTPFTRPPAIPSPAAISQVRPQATPAPTPAAPTIQPAVGATLARPTTPQYPGAPTAPVRQPLAAPAVPQQPPVAPPVPTPVAPVATPAPVVPPPAPVVPPTPKPSVDLARAVVNPDAPKAFFIRNPDGQFAPIEGREVALVPGIDTFVHRSAGNPGFTVTEARSGLAIAQAKSRSQAIGIATSVLTTKGEKVRAAVQQSVDLNGLSPRYTTTPTVTTKAGRVPLTARLSAKETQQLVEAGINPKAIAGAKRKPLVSEAVQPEPRPAPVVPTPSIPKTAKEVAKQVAPVAAKKGVQPITKAAQVAKRPEPRPANRLEALVGKNLGKQEMIQKTAEQSGSFDLFESRMNLNEAERNVIRKEFGSVRGLYDYLKPLEMPRLEGGKTRSRQEIRDAERVVARFKEAMQPYLNDVELIFEKGTGARAGQYFDGVARIFTDVAGKPGEVGIVDTAVHEVAHHLRRYLTPEAARSIEAQRIRGRDAYMKRWKSLAAAARKAKLSRVADSIETDLVSLQRDTRFTPNNYRYRNFDEYVAEGVREAERTRQALNPPKSATALEKLIAFIRRILQYIRNSLRTKGPIEKAYQQFLSREISLEIKSRPGGPLPLERMEPPIQEVPRGSIEVPEPHYLLEQDFALERAAFESGWTPELAQRVILAPAKGGGYVVKAGAEVLRGLQRREAKGLSVPENITAEVQMPQRTTDYTPLGVSGPRGLGMTEEQAQVFSQAARLEREVGEKVETQPEETRKGILRVAGLSEKYLRVLTNETLASKLQQPHLRMPEIFQTVYPGWYQKDLYQREMSGNLDQIYRDYKISKKEDGIVERYRARRMTEADEKYWRKHSKLQKFSDALTRRVTDPLWNDALSAGVVDPNTYVYDYFPGMKAGQPVDRFNPNPSNLTVQVDFAKPKKSNYIDPSIPMRKKIARNVDVFAQKAYLEPKLLEAQERIDTLYPENPMLQQEAQKYLKYIRNPYAIEGSAARQKLLRGVRLFSTLLTQGVASSKLGLRTAAKNILWGHMALDAYYGPILVAKAHKLRFTPEGENIIRRDGQLLMEEALPLIYGTFSTPVEGFVKGVTRVQRFGPSALAQRAGELYLRQLSLLVGYLDGKRLGLTGADLWYHEHLAVIKSQQIFTPVDMPPAFRGSGGRLIGQFIMPKVKQVNEMFDAVHRKQWANVSRWFIWGIALFTAASLLYPKKHLLTSDGKPYTSGGIDPLEGVDVFDIRKAYLARDQGVPGMLGMVGESFLSPAVKDVFHIFGTSLPSDKIYAKYLTPTEILKRDFSLIPQEASWKDLESVMEIYGMQAGDSTDTKLINTGVGLGKLLKDAKPEEREKLKQKYAYIVPFVGAAEQAGSELRSLAAKRSIARKSIQDNARLTKSEKSEKLGAIDERYTEQRRSIISGFNEKIQKSIQETGGGISSLFGIPAAQAATIEPQTSAEKEALSTPAAQKPEFSSPKTDAIAEEIARLEGFNAEGTLPQRLNNPGALKYAGQPGAVRGPNGFAQFSTPTLGWIALRKQILLDANRGLTFEQFVLKYAPPRENNSRAYMERLAAKLGATPRASLMGVIRGSSPVREPVPATPAFPPRSLSPNPNLFSGYFRNRT